MSQLVPIVVDDSVADRILPEPCGGSSSKERLQRTAKQEVSQVRSL